MDNGRYFKSMYVETLKDKLENERNLIASLISSYDKEKNMEEIDNLTAQIVVKFVEVENILSKIDKLL